MKIEDSPKLVASAPPPAGTHCGAQPVDPKDPEGFLRRCSGYIKKKGVRCSAAIGRNSHHTKNSHSTFLPTCHTHKDQQTFAGWCQFMQKDGERCGKLFRWTPPYFELCTEHIGHPDTPCYFMKLPLELRLEVFRYLLPSKPIGSSTSLLHVDEEEESPGWFCLYTHQINPSSANGTRASSRRGQVAPPERSYLESIFPVPLLNLLLISKQLYGEAKDLLYSTVPFTIDVRKDGTFMCGRRLLEPRRADGSSHSHCVANEVDKMKGKFLNTFDWAAVKNYNVDILIENWKDDTGLGYASFPWDEEVEIYDIRDYIGVVVSGILSKSRNLCKLNVRLGLSRFSWTEEELLTNIKLLAGPFERLRNVRQPRFCGVYEGTPHTNFMISLPVPSQAGSYAYTGADQPSRMPTPLCSVPQLPAAERLRTSHIPSYGEYYAKWECLISSSSETSPVRKPPIRAMFTEFKEFYTKLAAIVPDVMARTGRHAFLHRARVAREHEDVDKFREIRNELIEYWYAYLEQEERKKENMNVRLSKMLDLDIYPASAQEGNSRRPSASGIPPSADPVVQSHSPVEISTMGIEGPPGQGSVASKALNVQTRGAGHAHEQSALQRQQRWLQTQIAHSMAGNPQVQKSVSPSVLQAAQSQQAMTLNPLPSRQQHLMRQSSEIQRAVTANPDPHSRSLKMYQYTMTMEALHASSKEAHDRAQQQRQSAFATPVSQPQKISIPLTQVQSFRTSNSGHSGSSDSSPSSSTYSPTTVIKMEKQSSATGYPNIFAIPTRQQVESDGFDCTLTYDEYINVADKKPNPSHDPYSNDAPFRTTEVDLIRKRPGTEQREAPQAKKTRVDSGLGWACEERVFNENGDELMIIRDDPFKEWEDQASGCTRKGKGRATEPEVDWQMGPGGHRVQSCVQG